MSAELDIFNWVATFATCLIFGGNYFLLRSLRPCPVDYPAIWSADSIRRRPPQRKPRATSLVAISAQKAWRTPAAVHLTGPGYPCR
jgi:hypothetical protein